MFYLQIDKCQLSITNANGTTDNNIYIENTCVIDLEEDINEEGSGILKINCETDKQTDLLSQIPHRLIFNKTKNIINLILTECDYTLIEKHEDDNEDSSDDNEDSSDDNEDSSDDNEDPPDDNEDSSDDNEDSSDDNEDSSDDNEDSSDDNEDPPDDNEDPPDDNEDPPDDNEDSSDDNEDSPDEKSFGIKCNENCKCINCVDESSFEMCNENCKCINCHETIKS